ncbi:Cytosolic seryl-tRNA synthetase, partial [Fusarium sp. DS 682]
TLCATERTLCCILENYQTEDGLIVPEVLRKYIPGEPEFLPFIKETAKEAEKAEKKEGGKKEKTLPVRETKA